MEVKTNHEYHAMQSQIAAGTTEVGRVEEQMLVNMLEADEIAARLKKAEAALKSEEVAIADGAQGDRDRSGARWRRSSPRARTNGPRSCRRSLAALLDTFERVLKGRQGRRRRGSGRRPLLGLPRRAAPAGLQHDPAQRLDLPVRHCQRILYFTGVHERSAAGAAAADAPSQQHVDPDRARRDHRVHRRRGPRKPGSCGLRRPRRRRSGQHPRRALRRHRPRHQQRRRVSRPPGGSRMGSRARAHARAHQVGFAAARPADQRRLPHQERRTAPALSTGAPPDGAVGEVTLEHVRREQNKDADRLSNLGMDQNG